MKKEKLLIVHSYPDGLSRTQFRKLRKAEKLKVMLEWFYNNFEDPAERTPYETAEGGYQWIWGGPFEAHDELGGMFGGLASDALIEEAINEVQSNGLFEWAPTAKPGDYDDGEDFYHEPDIELTGIPDFPGPLYGSSEDHTARHGVLAALAVLENALPQPLAAIGHNNPPEPIDDMPSGEGGELRLVTQQIREEFQGKEPSIKAVKGLVKGLSDACVSTLKWSAKKIDLVIDEALKTVGKVVPITIVLGAGGTSVEGAVDGLIKAIIHWLHIVSGLF